MGEQSHLGLHKSVCLHTAVEQHALLNLGHAADEFPGHVFLLASAAKNIHLMYFFILFILIVSSALEIQM